LELVEVESADELQQADLFFTRQKLGDEDEIVRKRRCHAFWTLTLLLA
jgi:hypothetical protein